MALRRTHYLKQTALGAIPQDFDRPALCGRYGWAAVSEKREDIDCKACLKKLAAFDARVAALKNRVEDFVRTNTASYALGQMTGQHGRVWA